MWKSASASPGAWATFLVRPIRRSELMKVPSFSPHPAAGRTRSASSAVSVLVYMSCTTRKSSRASTSRAWRLVDPGVGGVGGDDPEASDLAGGDPLEDLVVGQAALAGDAPLVDGQDLGHRPAVFGVGEVAPPEQAGRVAEEARAHGVALPGDRVGAGARAADVAGHQGEVDDRLGGAGGLVALVHPHGPPERDPLARVDQLGQGLDPSLRQIAGRRRPLQGEGGELGAQLGEARRCGPRRRRRSTQPRSISTRARAVKQDQVGLRGQGRDGGSRPWRSRSCAGRRRRWRAGRGCGRSAPT